MADLDPSVLSGQTPPTFPPAGGPQGLQPAPAPGSVPVRPSPWVNVLQGALAGLSGVQKEGRGGFGVGLVQGAQGFIANKQRQFENSLQQQQLQFESAKAADEHIAAMDAHNQQQQLSDERKLDIKSKAAQYQAFLQDNFGIAPDLSFNDSHTDSNAMLTTLANQNGGTIPGGAAVLQPAPKGQDGQIAAYSPSQQTFQQNMAGYRKLIDTARAVQGQPPVDDATFNSMGFRGARDAASASINFLNPTPSFSLDKSKPDYLPTVLAQKKQQLQQYQNHTDANGAKDADPAVVKQLQNGIDYLNSSWETSQKQEADQAAKVTTAQENAKKPFTDAEHEFQTGLARTTAEINRQSADTNSRNLKADEMVTKEASDRDSDLSSIQGVQKQLDMAQNKGNQQAMADARIRFAEHEVKAGGINRFNETELNGISSDMGSKARQLENWYTSGMKGKAPDVTIGEMQAVLSMEAKQRTDLFSSHVNEINQNIRKQGGGAAPANGPDPFAAFGGSAR